ncbi:MAG: hypothetical protein CTR53_10430 [Ferrovibrio sp.]|nr:MAG: hypothetical protein CTR53_10430 [Ferrovibrio sp.]
MPDITLRRLTDYIANKHGLEAVCDNRKCRRRWGIALRQAVRALGDTARQDDLVGKARCPHCGVGRAARTDVVIEDRQRHKIIYFGGIYDEYQ